MAWLNDLKRRLGGKMFGFEWVCHPSKMAHFQQKKIILSECEIVENIGLEMEFKYKESFTYRSSQMQCLLDVSVISGKQEVHLW